MKLVRVTMVIVLAVATAGLWVSDAEAKKKKKPNEPKIATGPMDDGTMDPFWFGEGLEFREADEIDYLWVREGFTFTGQTLHFEAWPEPVFQGDDAEDRDENDIELATSMARDMAQAFADGLGGSMPGKIVASTSEGEILVSGRIVDCSTGSTAAKVLVGFGAGSGNTTIDLKLTDKETGELLVAIHHRVVSGTSWSTTDSKFIKWIQKLGRTITKKGIQMLYEKGDPTND
jgi:hypothetical protein